MTKEIDNIQQINKHYHRKFSLVDYLRAYLNEEHYLYQEITSRDELKEVIELSKKVSSILLIGVGFGRELDVILKSSEASKVTVIDINKNFLTSVKSVYNNDRLNLIYSDLNQSSKLEFPDNSFDLVLSLNTLEYIVSEKNFQKLITELARVLRVDGHFYFRLLNSRSLFGKVINYVMKKRSNTQTRYVTRDYYNVKENINQQFIIIKEYGKDISINFKPFRWLYSNYLCYLTFKIGSFLTFLLGVKSSPSVYFLLKKNRAYTSK